jgi:hypothetical protein
MITLGYLLKQYLDNTRDDSAENSQRGIDKINSIQKMLCASHNYHFLETLYTVPTVTGVGTFPLPKDYRKMITVSQTYGTREWPINEMVDPKAFNRLFYLSTVMSAFVAQYYHVRGKNLLIFPFCSTSTDYIKMFYMKAPVNMVQVDYNEGLITVTNAATTVTGSGTYWSTNVVAGSYIILNDEAYLIDTVVSDTQLTIDQKFQGATLTSQPYLIGDLPTIPEPFTDILWIGAAREYWALYKKDEVQSALLADRFNEYEARLKENTNAKTTEDFISPRRATIWNPNMYPTVTPALP